MSLNTYANTGAMNLFLKELSSEVDPGRHIALIVDNAGWHKALQLIIPANITLIPLPPYAPELNAMEQVWEWMRNHHLSNQFYKDYDQIVVQACHAWNEFSHNCELVKSIMSREWLYSP